MFRKLASNIPLLMLIAFNLYFIWYYQQNPHGFKTLLLIYWFQSVMIGFFTFVNLLTTPASQKTGTIQFEGSGDKKMSSGCSATFFAFHYGTFHLVYFVFLVVRNDGPVDFMLLKVSIFIIMLAELMEFIRKKQVAKTQPMNEGFIFFLPYLRIIPMHLMILGAAFGKFSDITLFLVLKTIADVVMHLVTNRMYFRTPT